MVRIDTVYQRVLAITNKEQRGYITPQEFNLLANQAQLEIFEQYFYDLNQFKRQPSETTTFSDMEELIQNKLSPFVTILPVANATTFPINYRIGKIFQGGYEVKKVDTNEINNIMGSIFHLKGLDKNPIYRDSIAPVGDIEVYNDTGILSCPICVTCEVVSEPPPVAWGYNVVGEKALYNATTSTDFQLHDSEESTLVIKILTLGGVIIKHQDIVSVSASGMGQKIQQQKS